MKRWAMCLTPAAAASPSARRPAFELPIFIATPTGGGGSETSPRKALRWRARSSRLRVAGTTSTKRNRAALSSASEEARSIALSSIAFKGLRVVGSALARRLPTSNNSRSSAVPSTMRKTLRPMARLERLLSIVAPMMDEEDTVAPFLARVRGALDGVTFEVILVDDGSRDGTVAAMEAAAAEDPRVKIVSLSRNFGHQPALTAGLDHARGDAVVMLDGDLQDPPEVIPQMLARWREGVDVVYAVRESREGETRMKLWTAHAFYRLMARMA